MNPTHLAFPNRLSRGSQFGCTSIRPSLLRLGLRNRLAVALGVELVDFASQLNQLAKLFERRHAAVKPRGISRGVPRSGVGRPIIRSWLLDDDVETSVTRHSHHQILAERQAIQL